MARKINYVTRSYDLSEVTVLQLNPGEGDPYNHTYEIPGKVKSNDKLLAQLRKKYEDPATLAICAVVDVTHKKKMIGCPEDIFLANAVELDEKTRRPKYPEPFASGEEPHPTGAPTDEEN